jgi:hypothetical protein
MTENDTHATFCHVSFQRNRGSNLNNIEIIRERRKRGEREREREREREIVFTLENWLMCLFVGASMLEPICIRPSLTAHQI